MAQRVVVTLFDDIDGGEAAETVTFGLDGKSYEIDLNRRQCKETAQGPRAVRGGRPQAVPLAARPYRQTAVAPDPAAVRAWARSNKMDVPAARAHPQEGLRGVHSRAMRQLSRPAVSRPSRQPTCTAPRLVS